MSALAVLTVDLDAVAKNFATLRAQAPGADVAPAVKADAYGMGDVAVARRLWAEGARRFFTARLEEGEAVRAALPDRAAVIYVLDGPTPGDTPRLLTAGLTPVLNSAEQIGQWRAEGGGRPAAIHVDTGMNRLGVRLDELDAALAGGPLAVELVMSHLACADEPDHPLNALQLERFKAARTRFPNALASLANSPGIFLGPGYHFDIVRPGVSLYGGGPRCAADPRIAPVATLAAPIVQVRKVLAGESIGYGATFTATHPMQVAVVAAGYADGLPRASSPAGWVWFEGARRRLLGRVSMDLIAVDVTGCKAALPGARVELVGPNITVDEAASASGATAYELLTRLARRATVRRLGEVPIAH